LVRTGGGPRKRKNRKKKKKTPSRQVNMMRLRVKFASNQRQGREGESSVAIVNTRSDRENENGKQQLAEMVNLFEKRGGLHIPKPKEKGETGWTIELIVEVHDPLGGKQRQTGRSFSWRPGR